MAADTRSGGSFFDSRVTLALFAALAAAAGSLHVLFARQAWWLVVAAALAVVLTVAGLVRRRTSGSFAPSAWAFGALVLFLTVSFASASALLFVLPTFGTVGRFLELGREAGGSIYRQAVPASADTGIVFVLAAGLGLVAIVSEAVVVGGRRPALAGIPLAGIVAIVPITEKDVTDPFLFALTAACYLLVLLAGRPGAQPGMAAAIGGAAIVGALVAPAALPAIDRSGPVTSGIADGVNPVLNLGDDLRRSAERDVLSYTTTSETPHYLRLVTLDRFTGQAWRPTRAAVDPGDTIDSFPAPPGLSGAVASTSELTSVDIGDLTSRWLPIPYPASDITGLSDGWLRESDGFSVSTASGSAAGESYEVSSLLLQPTPQQLLDAQSTVGPGFDRFVELPDDLPTIISETAATVSAESPTNYQKALALQEYFRSSAFRYSEQAPVSGRYDGTGMDVVARFLEERSGYCIHFASAMAVMARSLDIPARVVVGFLPGDEARSSGDSPVYEVTTHDLHSWPELYFDDVGWVQFEPTPGRGQLGQYADLTAPGVPAPDETVVPAAPVAPTPTASAPSPRPSAQALDGGLQGTAADQPSLLPWVVVGAAALIAVVLLPALVRSMRRRRVLRRLDTGRDGAVGAWEELLDRAVDLRIPVTPTDTPRVTARLLAAGGEPVTRLLHAVEREQYAGASASDGSGGRALAVDLDRVDRSLLGAATRRARLRARLLPPSVWRRILPPWRHPARTPTLDR